MLTAEEQERLRSQIPYFDTDPKYAYLADKKLLPQQRDMQSFEFAPWYTRVRRELFGLTQDEQNLIKQQQKALVPFDQEQKVMAIAPILGQFAGVAGRLPSGFAR